MFRVPLEEFLRHLLQKKSKKKSEIFPLKKFRTTFFRKSKKPCFLDFSQKLLKIFFWVFRVPLEEFLTHLLHQTSGSPERSDACIENNRFLLASNLFWKSIQIFQLKLWYVMNYYLKIEKHFFVWKINTNISIGNQ